MSPRLIVAFTLYSAIPFATLTSNSISEHSVIQYNRIKKKRNQTQTEVKFVSHTIKSLTLHCHRFSDKRGTTLSAYTITTHISTLPLLGYDWDTIPGVAASEMNRIPDTYAHFLAVFYFFISFTNSRKLSCLQWLQEHRFHLTQEWRLMHQTKASLKERIMRKII